ncbi:hypothetical protein [Paracoccus onubensis]|uniref:Sulfotransferase family protein n=1 Tax=Paracoccus onubensis TaxID=1675788 RepID=A0A418SNG6_9RHOB|nr:hypothetical protein [Paracoccus onubensis]RJE82442.1 hypothetical protein D3P04_20160 [Paracoccus onubensis]
MTKNVYLHIGHFKTGTTALQTYLYGNRKRLTHYNFAYPLITRPPETVKQLILRRGVTHINHADLSLTLARDHGLTPPAWYRCDLETDTVYQKLHEQIAKHRADNIIISSEEFIRISLVPQAEDAISDLRNRLDRYNVKILFYIREPFSLLKSWYNQINKSGKSTRTFPGFFMATRPQFLAQLRIHERFAKIFGEENLKVLTYKHSGSDHIREFLSTIDCKMPCGDAEKIVNKSSNPREVESTRLEGIAATGRSELTVTTPPSLAKIATRIENINRQYSKLERITDILTPSRLTCENLFSHYAELLSYDAPDRVPNPQEKDNLIRFSRDAEDSSPQLARTLRGAARYC